MSRGKYLLRRLGMGVFVIFGVLIITFFLSRVVPADPARLYVGARAKPEQLAAAREKLGLDDPLLVQFGNYISGIVQGDLGVSFRTKRPIIDDLKIFLPSTLELVIPSILLAVLIGIPVGVYGAAHQGDKADQITRVLTVGGVSIPVFWLALILQLIFVSWLGWLPLGGRLSREIIISTSIKPVTGFYLIDSILNSNWVAWKDALLHLILPVAVLATYPIALLSRMTRSSMIEALSQEYVTAARAAGLPQRTILYKLALKNAILPTLTMLGIVFAFSITGAILIEIVFQWPGLGKYLTDGILSSDFPVVLAVTLVVTFIYIVINLIVDMAQAILDPRIRLS